MLFNNSINLYIPFRPGGEQTAQTDIGYIQHQLLRWSGKSEYWGPRVWYYMHNTASYYVKHGPYTREHVQQLVDWLMNLPRLLPCKKCKYWYRKYVLRKYNLYTICSDKTAFFDFMIDIHNQVNTK